MDRQFLEFLGNFFLAASQGQKQLEVMSRWVGGKSSGSDEWTAMFRRCYGLESEAVNSNAWNQAMKQFQSAIIDWLALMNVVPRVKFEALQKENQALHQEIAVQQKTIQHLQDLLSDKGIPLLDAVHEFSRMTAQQSRQFQELMGSMGKLFRADKDAPEA